MYLAVDAKRSDLTIKRNRHLCLDQERHDSLAQNAVSKSDEMKHFHVPFRFPFAAILDKFQSIIAFFFFFLIFYGKKVAMRMRGILCGIDLAKLFPYQRTCLDRVVWQSS